MRLTQNPEVRNNPALLVRYLSRRAGLLLPRGVGVYTFPHRTFQEYLAACHLTDHDYPDTVAELAREEPNRWREVALLAGAKAARGTASAIWSLVEALCHRDLDEAEQTEADAWGGLLAGQALVESADLERVSERNQRKIACVRSHLVRVLEAVRLPAVERAAAGRSLAVLGDPRPGVGLRPDGLPDIAWCEVPAGPFLMGGEREPNETISQPYRIGRYPVTNAQFGAFVASNGYGERRYWTEAGWKRKEREGWTEPRDFGEPYALSNHPVVGVSWYEAAAFCHWLTEQLREVGDLDTGTEIALPNEPQWEKAARGTGGRTYPWGDEANPNRANYNDTGIGTTSAVGGFPGGTSPYGVEDLSGNVWEWTRSLWGTSFFEPDFQYPYDPEDGRENPEPGDDMRRVLRGGSFLDSGRYVRCACRYGGYDPNDRYGNYGFRVVASPVRSDL
jgi:formylglycine-generating enzyme required for sulfatase activity